MVSNVSTLRFDCLAVACTPMLMSIVFVFMSNQQSDVWRFCLIERNRLKEIELKLVWCGGGVVNGNDSLAKISHKFEASL